MNFQSRFVEKLDILLRDYSSSFVKTTRISFDNLEVTTYHWKETKLIIDVIGDECCLTATDNNIIYTFYDDDWEEVLGDIFNEIYSITNPSVPPKT